MRDAVRCLVHGRRCRGLVRREAMSNGTKTKKFLEVIDAKVREAILGNIASHYGITAQEAFEEVTDPEAEHLLDYVTGPERAATSVLMQKYGMAA